jgi:hypothetical protein
MNGDHTATEVLAAAAYAFAERIIAHVETAHGGKDVSAKAAQLIAAGAHSEVRVSLTPEAIRAALVLVQATGDHIEVASCTLIRRGAGSC